MKIDRLLFLAASAAMAANALACSSGSSASTLTADSGSAGTGVSEGSVRPSADAGNDRSEPSVVAEAGSDAGADADAADATADVDAGVVVPTGNVDEICAPFTCELGEWSCRAAVNGGLSAKVSSALYGCALTDCVPDKTYSELDTIGVACAATALAVDSAAAHVSALCSGLTSCATQEGTLSLDRCEVLYSGLTESGTAMLQSQTPTCGEIERYFIRGALSGLAYP